MRQYTYTNRGKTYARISKAKARAAYNAGLEVVVCQVNLRPGAPWYPEVTVGKEYSKSKTFEQVLDAYFFYHVRGEDMRYYPAFYIPVRYVDRFSGEQCNPRGAGAILEYDYKEGVEK